MKQALFSLCVLIVVAAVSGCTSTNSPTSTSSIDGSLTGTVALGRMLDPGSPINYANASGVTISLDGTSVSTTTDSSGFWKFDNLAAGNYDVTITKSGFGLTRIYGVAVSGPGTAFIPRVALAELPTKAPELVSADIVKISWYNDTLKQQFEREELQVRWKTSYDRAYGGLSIFLDKDAAVEPADVHFYSVFNGGPAYDWMGWTQTQVLNGTVPYSSSYDGMMSCSIETLHSRGITSGTKIYISLSQYDSYSASRGLAPNNNATYYDPIHNQNRLISPTPRSNVIEVTIP